MGAGPSGKGSIRDQSGLPPRAFAGSQDTPTSCPAPPQERTLAWSLCNVAHSAHKGETWAEALDSLLWVTQRVNCGAQI